MAFNGDAGVHVPATVGDRQVAVRFSLQKPETIATAAAGAQLALVHGGGFSGPAVTRRIAFEIERPVRLLRLQRPFAFGRLAADTMFVRTADYRGKFALPADADPDPDEIVVTADKDSKQPARLSLIVGLDRLASCSELTLIRSARRLLLRC